MAVVTSLSAQEMLSVLLAGDDSSLVWWTDCALRLDHLVGGLLKLVGVDDGERLAGRDIAEVFEQEGDGEASLMAAHRLALAGQPAALCFEWRGWPLQGQVMPQMNGSGDVTGCVGVVCIHAVIDSLEEALDASEQRFETLVGMSPAGIFMTDEAGRCTYVNHRWCEMAGVTAAEVLGRSWIQCVHPDDRDRVLLRWQQVLTSGSVWEHSYRVATPERSVLWVFGQARPLRSAGGRILGYVGITIDITRRKNVERRLRESEQRFQRLLSAVTSYRYSVLFREGVPVATSHSESCIGTTGYAPEEYARDPYLWINMVHAEDRQRVRDQVNQVLQGLSVPPLEHRIYHKNGTVAWVRNTMILHQTQDGRLVRYDGLVEDITERKRAEAQLRDQEAQLLAAQKIQEHLLPESAPNLPGYDIAARVVPARFAGGDYYDFLELADGTMAVIVGDVSGHDVAAALLMATTSAHLRSFATDHRRLEDVVAHTNKVLVRETDDGRFVTLFALQLNGPPHSISYVNAGHPDGYVISADGLVKAALHSTSFPLGVLPEAEYVLSGPLTLNTGDVVLLITDGILEARSATGDCFGSQRLLNTLSDARALSAEAIVQALVDSVRKYTGKPQTQDDLTVVVLKVTQ